MLWHKQSIKAKHWPARMGQNRLNKTGGSWLMIRSNTGISRWWILTAKGMSTHLLSDLEPKLDPNRVFDADFEWLHWYQLFKNLEIKVKFVFMMDTYVYLWRRGKLTKRRLGRKASARHLRHGPSLCCLLFAAFGILTNFCVHQNSITRWCSESVVKLEVK